MKDWIFKHKKWIVIIFFFFLFLGIAGGISNPLAIDRKIYELLTKNMSSFSTTFFKCITNFGSALYLIIITLLLLLLKNKKIAFASAINLAVSFGFNQLLKAVFSRARPSGISLIKETGYSFPSGHAMVSMAFYGFLIYLIYKSNWKKQHKIICITLLSILILAIGLSRIYLGVHYASDIIAGFSMGIVYLSIFISVLNQFKKWYTK